MYNNLAVTLPLEITRELFIDKIFEIGQSYDISLYTLFIAIHIADEFIKRQQECIALPCYCQNEIYKNIPTPKIYSQELAYVTCTIAGKMHEEFGLRSIELASYYTNNNFVRKMEWEICNASKFYFSPNIPNFSYLINIMTWQPLMVNKPLHPIFFEIGKTITKNFRKIPPQTILLGITLLYRKEKLSFPKLYREMQMLKLITSLAKEYEVSLPLMLRKFIKLFKR